jgi:hypothetical protein
MPTSSRGGAVWTRLSRSRSALAGLPMRSLGLGSATLSLRRRAPTSTKAFATVVRRAVAQTYY